MLTLILVGVPIAFLNEVNAIAASLLARGSEFLSVFGQPQRDTLAMFLNVHGYGFDVAGIFWGLWLFALGLLVYRSGFLPRILGVTDGELLRLSNKQSYVACTATVRSTCLGMDAAIPLWRTGVHAVATDHGCKAKTSGELILLCNIFLMLLKICDSPRPC